MTSMGTKNKIIFVKNISLSNGRCFLTNRKMSRSRMIIFNAIIFAGSFYSINHGLKFTNDGHVPVDPKKIFGRVVGLLLFNRFIVLVDRNILKCYITTFSNFIWINTL